MKITTQTISAPPAQAEESRSPSNVLAEPSTSPLIAQPLTTTTRLAFSVRESAQMLGVSEKSVRRLISRKLLRPSRALRHLRIPKKEIERFLDETLVQ